MPIPGTVCDDETVYVNANLRAMPYDAGAAFQWSLGIDHCNGLPAYTHSDWYLPSKDQLAALYANKAAIKEFNTGGYPGGWYWSSTPQDTLYAWGQQFADGHQFTDGRTYTHQVRCVRTP